VADLAAMIMQSLFHISGSCLHINRSYQAKHSKEKMYCWNNFHSLDVYFHRRWCKI